MKRPYNDFEIYVLITSLTFIDVTLLVVTRGHSWSFAVTRGHSWSLVVTREYFQTLSKNNYEKMSRVFR